MEENILVKKLQDKKTRNDAFSTLVKMYQKRLYWQIRNIVVRHEDADDVLQNTFIKIYENIGKFKGESQLFSWMYRIATNEALGFIKKQSKTQSLDESTYYTKQIKNLTADPFFSGDDAVVKLHKAIATLPEKQKRVFQMKYFQEMKYEEISKILKTSVGALKASYHIAKQKIEKKILATD